MFVDVCVFVCVCTQIQHLEQQWICTAVCLQGRAAAAGHQRLLLRSQSAPSEFTGIIPGRFPAPLLMSSCAGRLVDV